MKARRRGPARRTTSITRRSPAPCRWKPPRASSSSSNRASAKLLGILSLQALPRRVTLDFRDVFSEGFAFDEIAGTAKITRGVATTENFRIQGPAARVTMSGEVDLAQETQKLRVRIVPQVTETVAIAGALFGGPIAGVAAYLAQKILKDPLGQAVAFEYDVTGTWSDPTVKRVPRARARSDRVAGLTGMIRFSCGMGLLAAVFAAAAQTFVVPPELWDRPRSGRAVLEQPAIRQAVNACLAQPGARLVVHHGAGQESLLAAEELRSWLTALAIELRTRFIARRPEAERTTSTRSGPRLMNRDVTVRDVAERDKMKRD